MQPLQSELECLDDNGVQGLELAATFARLRIQVGDQVLTRAWDHETSAVRDCLMVPLYLLAT